jgi:hypothetical protein
MGFPTNNTGSSKPTHYLKIKTLRKDPTDSKSPIIGKCFTKSTTGEDMVSQKGYPLPFYGYLTNIQPNLDNVIKGKNGEADKPVPMINFWFKDDADENYCLSVNWTSDGGKINLITNNLLNSFAGIEKFGYLQLRIFESKNTRDGKEYTNFNISVKNDPNWVAGSENYGVFKKNEDGTDPTKASWKYQFTDIPLTEVKKVVDGDEVIINNTKKHQKFFLDIVEEVVPIIKATKYSVVSGGSTASNSQNNSQGQPAQQSTPSTPKNAQKSKAKSDDEWEKENGLKGVNLNTGAVAEDDLPF